MRRLRWTLLISFLFIAATANADSIPIFNITSVLIGFSPGDIGENSGGIDYIFDGPGIHIEGFGPFDCSGWCG